MQLFTIFSYIIWRIEQGAAYNQQIKQKEKVENASGGLRTSVVVAHWFYE